MPRICAFDRDTSFASSSPGRLKEAKAEIKIQPSLPSLTRAVLWLKAIRPWRKIQAIFAIQSSAECSVLPVLHQEDKMQQQTLDAAFSVEHRREELRAAVVAAERELSAAADELRRFQGENYSTTPFGLCVRIDRPDNRDVIDAGHRERVIALSKAHDQFQNALKNFSQL